MHGRDSKHLKPLGSEAPRPVQRLQALTTSEARECQSEEVPEYTPWWVGMLSTGAYAHVVSSYPSCQCSQFSAITIHTHQAYGCKPAFSTQSRSHEAQTKRRRNFALDMQLGSLNSSGPCDGASASCPSHSLGDAPSRNSPLQD